MTRLSKKTAHASASNRRDPFAAAAFARWRLAGEGDRQNLNNITLTIALPIAHYTILRKPNLWCNLNMKRAF